MPHDSQTDEAATQINAADVIMTDDFKIPLNIKISPKGGCSKLLDPLSHNYKALEMSHHS
jgi:hypothetical protein